MSSEIEQLSKAMGNDKDDDIPEPPQTGSKHSPYSALSKFDIYKVDYAWVDKETSKK